jgi:hypothetical protein
MAYTSNHTSRQFWCGKVPYRRPNRELRFFASRMFPFSMADSKLLIISLQYFDLTHQVQMEILCSRFLLRQKDAPKDDE